MMSDSCLMEHFTILTRLLNQNNMNLEGLHWVRE